MAPTSEWCLSLKFDAVKGAAAQLLVEAPVSSFREAGACVEKWRTDKPAE